ncbi:MAG: hypothetical protein WBY71_09795, partial [Nitrososphaeraceae archaeon]
ISEDKDTQLKTWKKRLDNYRTKSSTYDMDLLLNDNNSNSKKKHSQRSDVLNLKIMTCQSELP